MKISAEQIKLWITEGEHISMEFKRSRKSLSRSAFETICAMLNRAGGHILLGVEDDGTIEGIEDAKGQQATLIKDMNNEQLIRPAIFMHNEIVTVDGKDVICITVPESRHIHSYKGNIWDRNGEGDFFVKSDDAIAMMALRKQDGSSENRVYPQLRFEDFDQATFAYMRKEIERRNPHHSWLSMTDDEILRSRRMYLRDRDGNEGYTMAAALLFGGPMALGIAGRNCVSDLLYRTKPDMTLYDDRLKLDCNILQAYSQIFQFCEKHLDEKPYIGNDGQRISLRNAIMREWIINFLIHREYANPSVARLVITPQCIMSENANRPRYNSHVTVEQLLPFPKNPTIASVFREMGWIEEVGAGAATFKNYCPLFYAGHLPEIEDGDDFRCTLRLYKEGSDQESDHVSDQDGPVNEPLNGQSNQDDPLNGPLNSQSNQDDPVNGPLNGKSNQGDGINDGINATLSEEEKMMLDCIMNNPNITFDELIVELSKSRSTIKRIINRLRETGIISRDGSKKTGTWVVSPKYNRPKK